MTPRIRYTAFTTLLMAASPASAMQTIPIVQCPGDDGGPPSNDGNSTQENTSVNLDGTTASLLAFYAAPYGPNLSADGPGLIAPRGWQCFWEASADGNYSIAAAPTEKDLAAYKNYSVPGIVSAGISYNFWDGGTAGRDEVIPLSRYFSSQAQNGGTKSVLPDIISYNSSNTLQFETPAGKDGLGTKPLDWEIRKSNMPIYGVLHVDMIGDTDAALFKVKLPDSQSNLRRAILDNYEAYVKKASAP